MRIFDFNNNDRTWLKITDLENIFDINIDKKGNYVYNLNSALYFEVNEDDLSTYTVKHDMHWPLISYQLYNTPRLAWLLMKLNKVSTADVFKKKKAGEEIKYIPNPQIESIVAYLNKDF